MSFLGAVAAGASGAMAAGLPVPIVRALETAQLPAEALAISILPLDGGSPLLQHQSERPMQPASAMKVVTTAVALDRVGPLRRGSTELRTLAPVAEGRLAGDLIVRGGGDPELGLSELWALFQELRQTGIQEIAGDVLLDRTAFRPIRPELGVPPFDEAPEFPYNVIPDALQWSGGLHPIELRSDAATVQARLVPALPGVQVDNRLRVHPKGSASCREWASKGWKVPQHQVASDGTVIVILEGLFPAECTVRPSLQLMERNRLVQAQLRWLADGVGLRWSGVVRDLDPAVPADQVLLQGSDQRLLARREARPWIDWIRPINKVSDNVATRLLFLTLGQEEQAREASHALQPAATMSTAAWGERAVKRWMEAHGIATGGLVVENGSGLSRRERITPTQLSELLRVAQGQRHGPDLVSSLPLVGVDGSLRNRMVNTPAQGRARLKPGTLRNAVALAGYVEDLQGRRWALTAIVNHDEAPQRGRAVLDAVVQWLVLGPVPAVRPR